MYERNWLGGIRGSPRYTREKVRLSTRREREEAAEMTNRLVRRGRRGETWFQHRRDIVGCNDIIYLQVFPFCREYRYASSVPPCFAKGKRLQRATERNTREIMTVLLRIDGGDARI